MMPDSMRRPVHGICALLLGAFFVAPATGSAIAAQAPGAEAGAAELDGRVIAELEWRGAETLSEETLRYYLGLEQGSRLDIATLDTNIRRLWDRKLIDDITVEAEPVGGDRVRVTVTIDERLVLESVDYEGVDKLSRTAIDERFEREGLFIQEGVPIERGELERAEELLETMYREKGFRFADVGHTLEPVETGARRAVFTADRGDKVKISRIEFAGNTVFPDWRLRWMMRKTRESGIISRIMKRDIFNAAGYQEDIDRIRELYRERGYKNVEIREPELDVVTKGDKRRLSVTIPIEEGQRWKFGEVTIEGNEEFSDERLLAAFRRPHGRKKWLRASAIDKGVEAVTELYRNHGYIYSQVDAELAERSVDSNVADVEISIREGEQFRVGRLEFEGNDRTRDKVLRRQFRVHEAMILNMGAVRNSLFKIRQLNYFELDEENPIEFKNVDTEEQTVDLLVHGEEADRTELLFGAGWSELEGFFGQFSLQTRNFLGRGETLGVSVQSGRAREQYELSYFVPWFLDRPQSVGIQVFDREIDFRIFGDTQRQLREETGGVLSYGRSFGFFHSARLSYGFSDIFDTQRFRGVGGDIVARDFAFRKSNLVPSYTYNSIDNRLEPTQGFGTTVSLEYAGGPLGGEVELLRPEFEMTYYRPVTRGAVRTVVGGNLEIGHLEVLGDEPLPVFERYYIGGARSVRGFGRRSLFLRDEDGNPIFDEFGTILGGTEKIEVGLEYHVLLGGPFRLVFFTDAGNVFGDRGVDFDPSDLRYSAGVELRLFVPMFGVPLRFIYAENLDPLPGDEFESFQFDIGTSF